MHLPSGVVYHIYRNCPTVKNKADSSFTDGDGEKVFCSHCWTLWRDEKGESL